MALYGLLLVMLPSRLDALSRRWMESRALGIALLVARSTEPALDFDDGAAAANALAPLGDGALYAVLSGQGERPLAVHGRPPPRLLPRAGGPRTAYEPDLLRVQVPVLTRAGMRGTLEVGFGLEELEARHREARTLVAGGRPDMDCFVTVVRNQLDEIRFANASAAGCAMGREQAIDYALPLSMNL